MTDLDKRNALREVMRLSADVDFLLVRHFGPARVENELVVNVSYDDSGDVAPYRIRIVAPSGQLHDWYGSDIEKCLLPFAKDVCDGWLVNKLNAEIERLR